MATTDGILTRFFGGGADGGGMIMNETTAEDVTDLVGTYMPTVRSAVEAAWGASSSLIGVVFTFAAAAASVLASYLRTRAVRLSRLVGVEIEEHLRTAGRWLSDAVATTRESFTSSKFAVAVQRAWIAASTNVTRPEFRNWAFSVVLTLGMAGYVWALSTGAVLGSIFRRPLGRLGLTYESIKFSPIRLAVIVNGVEARPATCSLARTILLAILPSLDVVTDPERERANTGGGGADGEGEGGGDGEGGRLPRQGSGGSGSDEGDGQTGSDPDGGRALNADATMHASSLGVFVNSTNGMQQQQPQPRPQPRSQSQTPLQSRSQRQSSSLSRASLSSRASSSSSRAKQFVPAGSTIRIASISLTPSVRLWWIRPLSFISERRKRRKRRKRKGLYYIDEEAEEDEQAEEEEASHATGVGAELRTSRIGRAFHRALTFLGGLERFVAVAAPAPLFSVEVRGIRIEAEKVYLGPRLPPPPLPPSESSPSDQTPRRRGGGGGVQPPLEPPPSSHPSDEEVDDDAPACVVATELGGDDGSRPERRPIPTFDGQSMLERLRSEAVDRANSATFFVERWLGHERREDRKRAGGGGGGGGSSSSRTDVGGGRSGVPSRPAPSHRRHASIPYVEEDFDDDYSYYDSGTSDADTNTDVVRTHEQQRQTEGTTADGGGEDDQGEDDSSNALLQTTFRVLLSSITVAAYDFKLIVKGADAKTVTGTRDGLAPELAALALATTPREERAVTVVGFRKLTASFNGYDCDLLLDVTDLHVGVASPVPVERSRLSRKRSQELMMQQFPPFGRRRRKRLAFLDGGEARDATRREWRDVVPPCSALLHFSGVLDVLVWSTGYDPWWERRALFTSLAITNFRVHLDPEPLHTVLTHFDDYVDANSPHNEWQAWFRRSYRVRPLDEDERNAYRASYRELRLGKQNKQGGDKRRGGSATDRSAASPSPRGSVAIPEDKTPEEFLRGLEERMTFDQIMSERRAAMGNLWDVPVDSSELRDFIGTSYASSNRVGDRNNARTPTNRPVVSTAPQLETGIAPGDNDASSFVFDKLISLVEEKFALLSPLFTVALSLPPLSVDVFDGSACDSRGLGPPASTASEGHGQEINSTPDASQVAISSEITLSDFYIKYQTRSARLPRLPISKFLDGESAGLKPLASPSEPRAHQKVVLSIDKVSWLLTEGSEAVPTFMDGSLCGLLYKHPRGDPSLPSVDVEMITSCVPSNTSDSAIDLVSNVGDILAIAQPLALSTTMDVLVAASTLPVRDIDAEEQKRQTDPVAVDAPHSTEAQYPLSTEKQESGRLQEIEYLLSEESLASAPSSFGGSFEENTSSPAEQTHDTNGTILNGAKLRITVSVVNTSSILLMNPTCLYKGTMELNVQTVNLYVRSRDMEEKCRLSLRKAVVHACKLYLTDYDGCDEVVLHTLPLKEAFLLDDIHLSYSGACLTKVKHVTQPQEVAPPRTSPQRLSNDKSDRKAKKRQPDYGKVVMRVSGHLGMLIINSTPTFKAVLLGCVDSFIKQFTSSDDDSKQSDDGEARRRAKEAKEEEKERVLKQRRDAVREIWRQFDTDGSNTLDADEVRMLYMEIFRNIHGDVGAKRGSNQASKLTQREMQRELAYLQQLFDVNRDGTITLQDLNYFLFDEFYDASDRELEQLVLADGPVDTHYFDSKRTLSGIIYYDDLREYTSTVESYRITGVKDPINFPPASLWRQGQGIELFWEIFTRETGCGRASLKGQDVAVVQEKLVRSLCNYEFARYCWKILVKPNLQAQSMEVARRGERITRSRLKSLLRTDWVLDSETKSSAESHFINRVKHWADVQMTARNATKESNLLPSQRKFMYDIKLDADVDRILLTFGNALACTKPLLYVRVSMIEVSADASLSPIPVSNPATTAANVEGLWQPAPAKKEKLLAPLQNADKKTVSSKIEEKPSTTGFNLHFEAIVDASYLNTKHDVMVTLVEPFSTYASTAYHANVATLEQLLDTFSTLTKSSRGSRFVATGAKNEVSGSVTLKCPAFLSINTSPSLFRTSTLLHSILIKTTPEQYENMLQERLLENLYDVWDSIDEDGSGFLDDNEVRRLLSEFAKGRQIADNDTDIDSWAREFIKELDGDHNGYVSLGELSSAMSSKVFRKQSSVFDAASKIRIRNVTGNDLKFCTSVAFSKTGSTSPLQTVRHGKCTTLDLDDSFMSTIRSRQKSDLDMLVLQVPKCVVIRDIPISAFQTIILPLSLSAHRGRDSKSDNSKGNHRRRNQSRLASGFDPTLTLSPIADNLDTVTLEVRSSLFIEAHTPVDMQVVRVSSSHFRGKRGVPSVDLRKKRFANTLKLMSGDALIVFEVNSVGKGKRVPLPLSILLSSSLHMLLLRDSKAEDEHDLPWRAPILLTKEFLFNSSRRSDIALYHAKGGILVQRERLNVLESDTGSVSTGNKTQTSWDTAIQVLPIFVLTNGLPFSVQFRCWQAPREDDTDVWRSSAQTGEPSEASSEHGDNVVPAEGKPLTINGVGMINVPNSGSKGSGELKKKHTSSNVNSDGFFQNGQMKSGVDVTLFGLDMGSPMFIQLAQDIWTRNGKRYNSSIEKDMSRLCWTGPIRIDVDKLQAGGNTSGKLKSLPMTTAPLGDDVDVSLNTTVERNGITNCTIFSKYWIMNKSGFKMEFRFTGREETAHDSGVGGLPILVYCPGEKAPLQVPKREVSCIPLEGATEQVARVWWDSQTNGELVIRRPRIKRGGNSSVQWSENIGLDAMGQMGEISCGGIVLGVSIESLMGAFHLSNLISFLPRFALENQLHRTVTLLPLAGNKHDVMALLRGLEENEYTLPHLVDQFIILKPTQWTFIYKFDEADPYRKIGHKNRFVCMRVEREATDVVTKDRWHMISVDYDDTQYFTQRRSISEDIVGMIGVSTQDNGASSFMKIFNSTRPPLRVENRSNEHWLQFVQDDPEGVVIDLPPMTWCGYSWDNPHGKKVLRFLALDSEESKERLASEFNESGNEKLPTKGVSARTSLKSSGDDNTDAGQETANGSVATNKTFAEMKNVRNPLYSQRTKTYNPWKVGEKQRLPCVFGRRASAYDYLSSEVGIIGGSRVLSFSDSAWRTEQLELGHLRSGGSWKNISADVAIEGLAINLADDYPNEVLSCTLREFSLRKEPGNIDIMARLRHIQIDAMHEAARYPIILQPMYSNADTNSESPEDVEERPRSFFYSAKPREVNYWQADSEKPNPVFQASLSFLPQTNMLWFPSIVVSVCPLKLQVELDYVLRVADLVLNSLPEPDPEQLQAVVSDTIGQLNSAIKAPQRTEEQSKPSYFEKIVVLQTHLDLELDIRPERNATSRKEDSEVEGGSILALSSMGRATRSQLSAGLLTWVTNVSATFAHVSPTFKFPQLIKVNSYCDADDLLEEITHYYITKLIFQSYKVLFSMHVFGDPKQLVGQIQTGFTDLFTITFDEIRSGGEHGFGGGVSSLVTNVVGGIFAWLGKFSGSLADILDLASSEDAITFRPRALSGSRGPDHVGEGIMQGTLYFTFAITKGVTGTVTGPYRGIQEKSPNLFGKGVLTGVVGLVFSPLIGFFGFTSKVSDGISATTRIFDLGMTESRCRPARIVGWGGMMGGIGLPYLKAVGIRVHLVRYQKNVSSPVTNRGHGDQKTSVSYSHTTIRRASELKAKQEMHKKAKKRSPRVVVIKHPKEKYQKCSLPVMPMLLQDDVDTSHHKYAVAFETTLVLRCHDLQLSDCIVVELWKKDKFHSYARNRSADAKCSFTLNEIYPLMEKFYKGNQIQTMLQLTEIPSLKSDLSEEANGKTKLQQSDPTDEMGPVQQALSESKGLMVEELHGFFSGKDPVKDVVTPAMQEFALTSAKTRNRSDEGNILDDIQAELVSIKSHTEPNISEDEDDDWSISTTSTDSDEDALEYNRMKGKSSLDVESEQLYGYISLSFIPISW